jgi:formate dehydrogenase subunit gamma
VTIGAGWTEAEVEEILRRHAGRRGALLPILNDVQAAFGFVPDAVVPIVALALNLSRAEVHGVVPF